MNLRNLLENVKDSLRKGRYRNEASISQGAVLPVLRSLGWDVFDTTAVSPEHPIGSRRVDFALCDERGVPLMLIEVKQPGKAEGADQQLFEYSFHDGVPFLLLTDGREWHFYLPGEQGSYQERRVHKLDILERETEEVVERLARYLQKDRLRKGEALASAKDDYKLVFGRKEIQTTLPLAWQRLVDEPNELAMLLAAKVEDLCGRLPNFETCAEFISGLNSSPPPDEPAHPKPAAKGTWEPRTEILGSAQPLFTLAQQDLHNRKPVLLEMETDSFPVRNWADLCVHFVQWLLEHGHLTKSALPILNGAGRDKYFINSRKEHVDPSRDAAWKEVAPSVFVDTKYSTTAHVSNLKACLLHLRLERLQVKITVPS